jgi:hypothetical protein
VSAGRIAFARTAALDAQLDGFAGSLRHSLCSELLFRLIAPDWTAPRRAEREHIPLEIALNEVLRSQIGARPPAVSREGAIAPMPGRRPPSRLGQHRGRRRSSCLDVQTVVVHRQLKGQSSSWSGAARQPSCRAAWRARMLASRSSHTVNASVLRAASGAAAYMAATSAHKLSTSRMACARARPARNGPSTGTGSAARGSPATGGHGRRRGTGGCRVGACDGDDDAVLGSALHRARLCEPPGELVGRVGAAGGTWAP